MVKLEYLLEIDKNWIKTKKWWDKIKLSDELFPIEFKKVTYNQKNIFKIKFLYFIKKIFNIEDVTNMEKININNCDINKLINNFKSNFDAFKNLFEDDIELKNNISYILKYNHYFKLIKKKISQIIEPLFTDIYFDKLFRCDNDLTRLIGPIVAPIIYIYIVSRDLEKTINLCLNLDNISIQFFVVSYLILDNFMDDSSYYEENKLIFFKWFMNIVNNPENEVIINEEQSKVWQCIIFKKYFCLFVDKYPVNENKILYRFVKLLISTLKETDKIQKNSDIDDDVILESTFKKSYVACLFMAFIIIKNKFIKKNINLLCELVFLIQLYDDYFDIEKDLLENNHTYFNTYNSKLNFNEKVKKMILSSFLFLNDLKEKDNNVINIFLYTIKYIFLWASYIYIDKFDKELINYFLDYSYYDFDIFKYFDVKSYDQYDSNIMLNIFKNYIINYIINQD